MVCGNAFGSVNMEVVVEALGCQGMDSPYKSVENIYIKAAIKIKVV